MQINFVWRQTPTLEDIKYVKAWKNGIDYHIKSYPRDKDLYIYRLIRDNGEIVTTVFDRVISKPDGSEASWGKVLKEHGYRPNNSFYPWIDYRSINTTYEQSITARVFQLQFPAKQGFAYIWKKLESDEVSVSVSIDYPSEDTGNGWMYWRAQIFKLEGQSFEDFMTSAEKTLESWDVYPVPFKEK